MTHALSNRALISALVSISRDITVHQAELASPDLDDEEYADMGEAVLEMKQAMSEFLSIYKARLGSDPSLPSVELLLGDAWA